MDQVDQQTKQQLQYLLGSKGVMDHGRQPVEIINIEKWKSTFHLYITNTESEIDLETKYKEDLANEKDKFLRLFAEFENYKKRTIKERIELIKMDLHP